MHHDAEHAVGSRGAVVHVGGSHGAVVGTLFEDGIYILRGLDNSRGEAGDVVAAGPNLDSQFLRVGRVQEVLNRLVVDFKHRALDLGIDWYNTYIAREDKKLKKKKKLKRRSISIESKRKSLARKTG